MFSSKRGLRGVQCTASFSTPRGAGVLMELSSSKVRFGPFELEATARQLYKNGAKVNLRGQPYLILEILLQHAGEVVSREEIRQKVWSADTFVDFEHGLNTSIKKLRQVLCDSASAPRYIETLPRLGYKFIAPVETAAAPQRRKTDEDEKRASSAAGPSTQTMVLPFGSRRGLVSRGVLRRLFLRFLHLRHDRRFQPDFFVSVTQSGNAIVECYTRLSAAQFAYFERVLVLLCNVQALAVAIGCDDNVIGQLGVGQLGIL